MATTNGSAPQCIGSVTLEGKPLSICGSVIAANQAAPAFHLLRPDLSETSLLDYRGRVVILSTVPSLDTSVCNKQALRWNEEAPRLASVAVLTVSMDLPFAQKRWMDEAGVKNVDVLSAHRSEDFGLAYGVLIAGLRLLARAVFVIGPDGVLRYREVVPELTRLPDFDAAIAAARRLL